MVVVVGSGDEVYETGIEAGCVPVRWERRKVRTFSCFRDLGVGYVLLLWYVLFLCWCGFFFFKKKRVFLSEILLLRGRFYSFLMFSFF